MASGGGGGGMGRWVADKAYSLAAVAFVVLIVVTLAVSGNAGKVQSFSSNTGDTLHTAGGGFVTLIKHTFGATDDEGAQPSKSKASNKKTQPASTTKK